MMKFIIEGMALKDIHEQILESAHCLLDYKHHNLKNETESQTVAPAAAPAEDKHHDESKPERKPRGRPKAQHESADEDSAKEAASVSPSVAGADIPVVSAADVLPILVSKATCQGLLKEICEAYNIDKAREILARFKVASVSDMKEYQYAEFAKACRDQLATKKLE